jgi:4-amino-4-deoxy-L-arabinose transferase-like glycosyltransferase
VRPAALRWIAVAVFAAAQAYLALDDTPTPDEPRHLRDGATVLRDGRIDVNPEHPPLVKVLAAAALPGAARDAALAGLPADPMVADAQFGVRLPLRGASLLSARLPPILIAIVGLIAFGSLLSGVSAGASAAATVLLAFSPLWLAQGHYATTDVAPIAFLLAAAWAVRRFPTAAGAALAGLFLGAALLSKFSAPLLVPFALLWILLRARLGGLAAAVATALCLVVAVEAFAVRHMTEKDLDALSRLAFVEGGIGSPAPAEPRLERIANTVVKINRPLGAYAIGFLSVLQRSASAEGADYWSGRIVAGAQPLYPVETLAIKNDLPLLLAAALGAAALWTRRRGIGWGSAIALSAGLLYLAAACRSSMHWGSRYLLPLVVLLAGLATATLLRPGWSRVLAVLAAAHVLVAAFAFPHYLTYRNALAPLFVPPATSWDFGEDWGQDLGRALASQGRPVRYLSLLHYRVPEWRTLFPLLRPDDDETAPWLVDRLALDVALAGKRSDVPASARPQLAAIQPILDRVDVLRGAGEIRATSEPTLFLIEAAKPR